METDLQFFRSVRSSLSLFSSGRTMASLNSAVKQPAVSDLSVNKATKGESIPLVPLTSHVGAVSSWHVLFGAELISFATSSTVTAVKSASDNVTRRGTSYIGVATVDARTESALFLKYLAKSSAESKLSSSLAKLPSTPWSVRLRADRQRGGTSCKGTMQVRDATLCRKTAQRLDVVHHAVKHATARWAEGPRDDLLCRETARRHVIQRDQLTAGALD